MSTDYANEKGRAKSQAEIVPVNPSGIQNKIYVLRDQQVMFDFDLALIYGYEVRTLNQQVTRNISRFPDDFMFELTKEEVQAVKSQIVTSQDDSFFSGQAGGRRKPPKAFTEQGIYMLGTVLRGPIAEQQTIFIMRAFREMKQFIANNALLFERIRSVELRQLSFEEKTDTKFGQIFEQIADREVPSQKVFFDGQIFDAFSMISNLIRQAKQEIILIDNYIDTGTLDLLSKKRDAVDVIIHTTKHGCRLTASEVSLFNKQYPSLQLCYTNSFHDRFLILDRTTSYHVGASIKDAGKKCFAISQLQDAQVVQDILQRL